MKTPDKNTAKTRSDEELAERARGLFADSVERIDAATLSKLNQHRQRSLEELSGTSVAGRWRRWTPVTGLAATAAVAMISVALLRGPATTDIPGLPDPVSDDFEILIGSDDLDMIEELEFYSWIELAELDIPGNVG